MKVVQKVKAWWRGTHDSSETADPEHNPSAIADGQRIRGDVETLRTGSASGPENITHRGRDSTRGF
jgi:hypothetical protein